MQGSASHFRRKGSDPGSDPCYACYEMRSGAVPKLRAWIGES
jgi:hypothetical protein